MVNTTLGLNDNMTRVLRGIVRTLDTVITALHRLDHVSASSGSNALSLMREEIIGAQADIAELNALLNDMGANAPPDPFRSWRGNLMSLYAGVQLVSMAIRQIGNIANMADEYTSINSRVGLINDGLQTQHDLQNKILESANRTRASYKETANLISKIGMTGAIKGNDSQIAFAEKVNKMLKLGGGTASMNESALLQLSQSLSSGVMQGDEFKSLMENAPALMQNIAKGMGVSKGELKALASEGKLTTETIINAINKMGGSIDEQFNKLPRTFGENKVVFENMVGTWLARLSSTEGALGQLNQRFTDFVNFLSSPQGVEFLDNIGMALGIITGFILFIFDTIGNGIGVINDFGGVFEGVFTGVIVASLLIIIPMLWSMIPPIVAQAMAWAAAHAPILLIALAIGILVGLLKHFGITAGQVVGFVGGLFGGLAGHLVNIFFFFYNFIGQFATFFHNVFHDPVFAVQSLFYGLVTNVLGFFEKLVNGIIDGLNVVIRAAKAVGANVNELQHRDFTSKIKAPTSNNKNVKNWENRYVDVGEFSQKGSKYAIDKLDNLTNALSKFNISGSGMGGANTAMTNTAMGEGKNIGDVGKVGKVGSIEKDVKIADEDIKMLYQMAVGDRVNQINLTVETKAPNIVNNNNISRDVDIDHVYEKIATALSDEANISVKQSY
ncbi:tape measure protein [Peptoanaerobacter stomatis]|uniref:tape measure protein n=1 Tax=Peptoanaerobacter stomatis TaxID=796937 RepID=UPI003FA1901F